MKKLALMATTAAIFLVPAASHADNYKVKTTTTPTHNTRVIYKDDAGRPYKHVRHQETLRDNRDDGEFRVNVQSEEDFHQPAHNMTFTGIEGQKIQIDGKSVYLVTNGGMRYYAPTGTYATTRGVDIVAESGQLLRIEEPAQMKTVDIYDDYPNNRNRM